MHHYDQKETVVTTGIGRSSHGGPWSSQQLFPRWMTWLYLEETNVVLGDANRKRANEGCSTATH